MTHTCTSNQRDRRFLSFPAVHPCESISATTLITSLLTLSQTICNHFQPESFPTQRKNARETIRQITIISIFLHEIRNLESSSSIPTSIILPFSDLHFTLQKLHFLMQDCTLQGTRLLLLAKSHHVATQFRSLIRAAATALDVLPLHMIQLCDEVKELVVLVTKQASKAKFQIDPNDERETKRLNSVLSQFERGSEPDVSSMQQILDYLKIKSWSDCDTEIKFLENELSFSEREIPLLSSLIGFLTYSRVVIFETLDCFRNSSEPPRCSTEMMMMMITTTCLLNPEDFRCPISLELMTDPVTVSTGQTYDRVSIQKWLNSGNTKCPKTGEELTKTELIPNTTLKRLIQQFCIDNGISISKSRNRNINDITRTNVPGSPAAAHATQFLSWFLTRMLVFGSDEQKNKAAYEIRVLARSNVFNRACLIEVGTIPPLIELLETEDDRIMQENAISALMKLSKHSTGPENIITSNGLKPIISVLKNGISLESRQIAAAVIFYLCSVKEYRKLIGENQEAIQGLVELVKEGTPCGKKNAVVAIFGLLLFPKNHQRMLDAGVIPAIIDILGSSDKEELITEALAVLAVLVENFDGAYAVVESSALQLITGMLRSAASRAGKEHCASILLSLCVNVGAEVVGVLAKDNSLMPLLYSLLTDGTSHAAKKARLLIRILQDFHETAVSELKGCSVPREQTIRRVW